MDNDRVIAVTGHRPHKLGGYDQAIFDALVKLASEKLSWRPERVITGMALGWDQAVAQACIDLSIPFTAAVPFSGQSNNWPQPAQDFYASLMDAADLVEVVCPGGYAAWKMQRRNEWAVDRAGSVLALWDGTSGGTANCVRYATRLGRPIENCWNDWEPRMRRLIHG